MAGNSDVLTPNVYIRAKFDDGVSVEKTQTSVESLVANMGVEAKGGVVAPTSSGDSYALKIGFNITVKDIKRGPIDQLEDEIERLDGFKRFEVRATDRYDVDDTGEIVELSQSQRSSNSEDESLGHGMSL